MTNLLMRNKYLLIILISITTGILVVLLTNLKNNNLSPYFKYLDHMQNYFETRIINNTYKNKQIALNPIKIKFLFPIDGDEIKLKSLSPININIMVIDKNGSTDSISIKVDGNIYTGTNALWTPAKFGSYKISANVIDNNGILNKKDIFINIL